MGISSLIIIVRDELGEIFIQQYQNPKAVTTQAIKSSAISVSDSSKKLDISVRYFNQNLTNQDSFGNFNRPKVKNGTDAGYLSYSNK
jgi:hypothetical protein